MKELASANGVPRVPAGVGVHGKALWQSVWVHAQSWITPDLDLGTVELACLTRDFVEACRARVTEDGLTIFEPIVSPKGELVGERIVPHPLLKEQRAAEKQLLVLLSALALTPTDRARLGLAQVKQQSVVERLIEQRERRQKKA